MSDDMGASVPIKMPRIRSARKAPFSSVVGQSITLHDDFGAVICQMSIIGVRPGLSGTPEQQLKLLAGQVLDLIRWGVEPRHGGNSAPPR